MTLLSFGWRGLWRIFFNFPLFPTCSLQVPNGFPICSPMGVPNIALGIKLVLPQVPTRQVLVPWYEAGQSICLCSSVSLSLCLSLFTLIHIWRGKQQMMKFQVVKIWSSSHECSYICSELRTAPFCLRQQARDCCHLSSKMPYFLLSQIVDQTLVLFSQSVLSSIRQ
jgi:hypothetical protein